MSMMDDETVQMYMQEAKEHLEDIEGNLLEIEQAGENADEDLVNKVFRAAHSIKGGAGFLGLSNIKELAHKIENVLDMIRNRQLVPSPEVINIVLLAFDRLSELVDDPVQSNEMDIAEHVVALQGLTSSHLEEGEKESLQEKAEVHHADGRSLFSVPQFDLKNGLKGGKHLYLVEYDLIHDVQRKNLTPLDVIKNLGDGGTILDLKMDLASVGTLDSEELVPRLPMFVLFASIIEPDLVGKLLGVGEESIRHISEEEVQSMLGLASGKAERSDAGTAGSRTEEPAEETAEGASRQPDAAAEGRASSEQVASFDAVSEERSKADPTGPGSTKPQHKAASMPQEPAPAKNRDKEASGREASGRSKSAGPSHSDTLRVHVSVLDQLMNLAGELVLSRNQLLQSIHVNDTNTIQAAGQRIDLVTSELQEAIMLTRMQPVGNIFNKFPRVVRDLSRELDKDIDIEMEGKEVELDKAIIEGLGDPLTHLVRNAADHGIEPPQKRAASGKPQTGHIVLRAYHESGQVNIEIQDDGRGMDAEKIAQKAVNKGLVDQEKVQTMSDKEKINLIMLPGLSTADEVSDLSGRGVGMDVVKSNLDKLGGQVDIEARPGEGTTLRIKLPLTLAIIPSLLVSSGKERFAIAQVNVSELLRISASQIRERIERVGDAEVLILRGELIPLVHLREVLQLPRLFWDPEAQQHREDRRSGLLDRRLQQAEEETASGYAERRSTGPSDVNIVVVQAGPYKYGLVVDELHDSVEIVVKPLGRHLKGCQAYAGATIMGDGHVALILDVPGLARIAELSSMAGTKRASELKAEQDGKGSTTRQSLLLFQNGPEESCAVPLHLVGRVEQIKASDIEIVGGKKVIQYRGGNLPVFALEEVASVDMLEDREELIVLVFGIGGREVGLLAAPPVDALEVDVEVDDQTLRQPGISGSAIIKDRTTLLVDIYEVIETLNPQWFERRRTAAAASEPAPETAEGGDITSSILLAEDSDFFRRQVKKIIEEDGHVVVGVGDGQEAWRFLSEHPKRFRLVVTDLEMPNLDGFELTRKIKADERLSHLPVIALTSLASEEDMAKGDEVGIDDYQIKLDKDHLLQSIGRYMQQAS